MTAEQQLDTELKTVINLCFLLNAKKTVCMRLKEKHAKVTQSIVLLRRKELDIVN